MMSTKQPIERLSFLEKLNFLITNRIPRQSLTQFIGWFSKIENPIVAKLSIATWKLFADDLRLDEAKKSKYKSLHDCFVRELKPGVRPIDGNPDTVVSPCDAIVGECGSINGTKVLQAKGFPYDINELLLNDLISDKYKDGIYVTLRLKSSMYHRFHAPINCKVKELHYYSGDTWNVNPIALKKIEKLFCKNERAVIELIPDSGCGGVLLAPVAAILVACMKFRFIESPVDLKYSGLNYIDCDAQFTKGDEMGHFQHGSTIILMAEKGHKLLPGVKVGHRINMGEPLLTGHVRF